MHRWTVLSFIVVLSASLLGAADDPVSSARHRIEAGLLLLKAGDVDVAQPPPVPPALRAEASTRYHLLKLDRTVDADARRALEARGLEILDYVPVNGLVVRGPAERLAGPGVVFTSPLHPYYKLDPEIGRRTFTDGRPADARFLRVTIWPGESMDDAIRALAERRAHILQVFEHDWVRRVHVRIKPELLNRIAAIDAVSFVEEIGQIVQRNNATTWVLQTNVSGSRTLWSHGLRGEGQILGHIDGRIDMNHCMFRDPAGNTPGPNHRKVIGYHSNSGLGSDSHGTHTAGTGAGDRFPIDGSLVDNGHAYHARISHSNLNDIRGWNNANTNLAQFLQVQHGEGARVHTNSWERTSRGSTPRSVSTSTPSPTVKRTLWWSSPRPTRPGRSTPPRTPRTCWRSA